MSLHRVASIESWERSPLSEAAAAAPRPRKMSFNPISDWVPAPPEEQTKIIAPAEQISSLEKITPAKRIAQIVIASIYCLLSAGLVFGFAALKPVLVAEGVYAEYCSADDPGSDEQACYEQELRLNLMFAVAAVATNVCALPGGTVLDRYGPQVSTIIGAALLALGSALFIVAPHAAFDCYLPAYILLALGGPFVFISTFQLSNCFPRNSGLVLALLTGAFDSSSAVFLVYRLTYQATNRAFTPTRFFTAYLSVPVLIVVAQLAIMPKESYKTVGEMVVEAEVGVRAEEPGLDAAAAAAAAAESLLTEFEPLLGDKGADERRRDVSGVWGALHGRTALQQIRTPWFALMLPLVVVQMTRVNYFVATVRSQYVELFDGDLAAAAALNDFFDVALPAGGVVAVPLIGLLLDGLSTTGTVALLAAAATTIGVLGVVPHSAWAAYANVALFSLYRPLFYTAVSDYAAKVFGFRTFGKVYGLIICVAGLANLSQPGLDALTHRRFGGDPVPVNLALMAAVALVGSALTLYVWRESRNIADKGQRRLELEREAEHSEAAETLLPAATDLPPDHSNRVETG